ncbi:hypothetical protein F4802DRAFT_386216 [Xylaria palmicola]|nr:hypothetical protein F4802DRAFT_386216 [Xylaria palmicola]
MSDGENNTVPGLQPHGQKQPALSGPLSDDGKLNKFIITIAEELIASIPQRVRGYMLPDLSASLPGLLAAFASRNGYMNSPLVNLRLMHLVYRYRLRISDLVTGAFRKEAEDTISPDGPSHGDAMLLDDNLSLWERKQDTSEGTSEGTSDNCPDDDFGSLPELREYRDAMLNSPAYSWLMSAILTVLRLEIIQDDTAAQSIRSPILAILGDMGQGDIEQRMRRHHVTFRVPRPTLGVAESVREWSQTIVTLGEENHAYATSCAEYAQLVWPKSGLQILELLVSTELDYVQATHTCTLFDNTEVTATTLQGQDTMDVAVAGCIDSIAEVGEQLAWIGTVWNSLSGSVTPGCLAAKKPLWNRLPTSPLPTASAARGSAGFVLELSCSSRQLSFEPSLDNASGKGKYWTTRFEQLTLLKGFPIPRRPERGTGIEISLPIIAEIADSQKLSFFSGKPLIKGLSTAIIPTRHCDEFIHWHMIYTEDGDHLHYNDPRVRRILHQCPEGLKANDIESARHILG